MTNPLARSEAEDFLFKEAALLDAWRLEEWANLFTEDGEYLIPATDAPDGAPGTSLYLVYDDRHRLGERAKRLLKKTAHAEQPRSRTRHMSSNVMVAEAEGAGVARPGAGVGVGFCLALTATAEGFQPCLDIDRDTLRANAMRISALVPTFITALYRLVKLHPAQDRSAEAESALNRARALA